MKQITIFTPTYNRAFCLPQLYESLVRQTNKDFCWLVIDDGSTDNTKELVDSWRQENKIQIQYHYQENQGMHGGHNSAYGLIDTELNVCIDSDDYMADDAIEKILQCWSTCDNTSEVAGIIGLDGTKDGKVLGDRFPEGLKRTTLENLHYHHKIGGDKKLVLRTEVVNQYPKYPLFKEERFVPLGILYLMIDKDFELICLDEILCIVEYLPDGSSRNMIKQYWRHPRGFRHARIVNMIHSNYPKVRFKNAVHFISHSIQLKDWAALKKSPKKGLTILALPLGVLLFLYVWYFNTVKK